MKNARTGYAISPKVGAKGQQQQRTPVQTLWTSIRSRTSQGERPQTKEITNSRCWLGAALTAMRKPSAARSRRCPEMLNF